MKARPFPSVELCAELAAIIRDAAKPLLPAIRAQFYERVCAHLNGERELGPGSVSRACRLAQAEFISDAPQPIDGRC
jgi:hypothetical protein